MGRPDRASETTTRRIGEVVVVSPAAELDMATAPSFVQAVEDARDRSVGRRRGPPRAHVHRRDGHPGAAGSVARKRRDFDVSFIRASDRVHHTLRLLGAEEALTWTDAPPELASQAM
jgi:hypothetical protein